MNQVTVKRIELLGKIKANRNSHRELFLKAQEGYREDVIKELDTMLQEARDGKEIRRSIRLPEPQDHTEDYNTVIAMLEMATDEVLLISNHEFQMYVMDNWGWKAAVTATNMSYLKAALK